MHCPLPNGHCAWSILPVGGANGYWRQAALAVFWVQADIAVSGLLTSQAAFSGTLREELFCESRAWGGVRAVDVPSRRPAESGERSANCEQTIGATWWLLFRSPVEAQNL